MSKRSNTYDQAAGTVFSEAVKAVDYDVEIITDGEVSLARLTKVVPDLVVLDLHLPHIDGGVILNHIRSAERIEKTRVIVATADARMPDGDIREQSDFVFIKPVEFELIRVVAGKLRPASADS